MRHWQLTSFDQNPGLVLREAVLPEPAFGQVRLRMLAASLNYRDLLVLRRTYAARPDYAPIIPLSDGVGVVEAIGPGVDRVKVGDRVASTFMPGWIDGEFSPQKAATALGGGRVDGVLSERVNLPAEGLVAVPPHLTDEEAARFRVRR